MMTFNPWPLATLNYSLMSSLSSLSFILTWWRLLTSAFKFNKLFMLLFDDDVLWPAQQTREYGSSTWLRSTTSGKTIYVTGIGFDLGGYACRCRRPPPAVWTHLCKKKEMLRNFKQTLNRLSRTLVNVCYLLRTQQNWTWRRQILSALAASRLLSASCVSEHSVGCMFTVEAPNSVRQFIWSRTEQNYEITSLTKKKVAATSFTIESVNLCSNSNFFTLTEKRTEPLFCCPAESLFKLSEI